MKPPDNSYQRMLSRVFDDDISSGKRLFFIQGMWRSGTSWLGRMIGSHPRLYVCHHELQSFMGNLEIRQFGTDLAEHPFPLTVGRHIGGFQIIERALELVPSASRQSGRLLAR